MRILARSLSPDQGGSYPRILGTTRKLQILQQVEIPNVEEGNTNLAVKGSPLYVGITPNVPGRVDENKKKKGKKKGKNMEKERKRGSRRVEDGVLLVFSPQIYGEIIKSLIDSGVTRCSLLRPVWLWLH